MSGQVDPEARMLKHGVPCSKARNLAGLLALACALPIGLGACTTYKQCKPDLALRIMKIDANEVDLAFRNKIQASREVSGGRPGFAAGGGCGCSN
jgi:uncharacterized protein DUF4266